jgi:hypothetical protein
MGIKLNFNIGSRASRHEGDILPKPSFAPGQAGRVLIDKGDSATAAILPLLVGGIFSCAGIWIFVYGPKDEMMLKFMMVVFTLIGLGLFWVGFNKLLVAMRFAPGRLEPSVWPLRLGENFTAEYSRRAKGGGVIDSMSARLFLRETAIYRRGTDTYTDTEIVMDFDLGEIGCGQDGRGDYRGSWEVDIPATGPSSFDASNNKLDWMFEVKIFSQGEKIDESEFRLVVVPEIAPEKPS